MASTGEVWRLGRRPALDGLRGLAILLVVCHHAAYAVVVRGGEVGVTVLFVLSGFLITKGLLAHDGVRFRQFYARRARRLLPALLTLLAATPLLYWVTGDPRLPMSGVEVLIAGLYLMDFYNAAHPVFGTLGHTWSLAVEEQFYLVWPVVLAVVSRLRMRVIPVVTALFVLAVAWRIVAGEVLPESRVYFGPDTNAFAPLVGCLLACLPRLRWQRGSAVPVVSVALLPTLALLPASARWVDTVVTLSATGLTALLIVALPDVLTVPWLRWLGRISYGWYLWHAALMWHDFDGLQAHLAVRVLLALIALGIAAASWRYVEAPFLRLKHRPRAVQFTAPVVVTSR